jgi:hypothetical protein
MKMIIYLSLIIIIISAINGQWSNIQQPQPQQQRVFQTFGNNFQNDMRTQIRLEPSLRIPFPQCLSTEAASNLFDPSTLQNLFQLKLQQEDAKLKQERVRNDDLKNSMFFINSSSRINRFFL